MKQEKVKEKTEGMSLRQRERGKWLLKKLKDEEKEQRKDNVRGSGFHGFCN